MHYSMITIPMRNTEKRMSDCLPQQSQLAWLVPFGDEQLGAVVSSHKSSQRHPKLFKWRTCICGIAPLEQQCIDKHLENHFADCWQLQRRSSRNKQKTSGTHQATPQSPRKRLNPKTGALTWTAPPVPGATILDKHEAPQS